MKDTLADRLTVVRVRQECVEQDCGFNTALTYGVLCVLINVQYNED